MECALAGVPLAVLYRTSAIRGSWAASREDPAYRTREHRRRGGCRARSFCRTRLARTPWRRGRRRCSKTTRRVGRPPRDCWVFAPSWASRARRRAAEAVRRGGLDVSRAAKGLGDLAILLGPQLVRALGATWDVRRVGRERVDGARRGGGPVLYAMTARRAASARVHAPRARHPRAREREPGRRDHHSGIIERFGFRNGARLQHPQRRARDRANGRAGPARAGTSGSLRTA